MTKQQLGIPGILNPAEAPAGFYAMRKSDIPRPAPNLCRFCDWRTECQKPETDFTVWGHRCMSYPIETPDGRTITRQDGCSVVFKKAGGAND